MVGLRGLDATTAEAGWASKSARCVTRTVSQHGGLVARRVTHTDARDRAPRGDLRTEYSFPSAYSHREAVCRVGTRSTTATALAAAPSGAARCRREGRPASPPKRQLGRGHVARSVTCAGLVRESGLTAGTRRPVANEGPSPQVCRIVRMWRVWRVWQMWLYLWLHCG